MADIVKEVVISLSRNIKEFPFTNRLDKEGKEDVASKIDKALCEYDEKFKKFDVSQLEREEILSILEKFYISKAYMNDPSGKYMYVSEDYDLILITNGENHIKIISKCEGLDFESAYSVMDRLDDHLSDRLPFAFSKEYGYLSPNIETIGTGMRATAILHLSALDKNRSVAKISSNLSKLGLIIKPLYTDNIRAFGDTYSLTNSVMMGITEKGAIENLKNITKQLENQEKNTMDSFVEKPENRDAIYRSYGILKYARLMKYSESLDLLSNVRMGILSGLLDGEISKIDRLVLDVQPVNILRTMGDEAYENMDEKRADIIREALS